VGVDRSTKILDPEWIMIEGLFNRPSDLSQMVMPGAVLKPLRASFLLGGWVLFCVHSVTVIISHTARS
jgi:hypothetical protein